MNVLFVCSRNKWRSRTAEEVFKNNGQHQVRSAGTETAARIKINQKLINWADLIFVMEKKHKVRLLERFTVEDETERLIVLDIPDEYSFMDAELVEVLKTSLAEYFK